MNETNTTPRQQKILDVLGMRDRATRAELADALSAIYPVSKPTLARDIKRLLASGQVQSSGAGRSISYRLPFIHPLLKPVNLSGYFDLEPDQRTPAKKQ